MKEKWSWVVFNEYFALEYLAGWVIQRCNLSTRIPLSHVNRQLNTTSFWFNTRLDLLKWPVLWGGTFKWSPANCPEHSLDLPRVCTHWKRYATVCLVSMLPQQSLALVFVSSTRSFKTVIHPSTILAKCCLTSVFKWELVFRTWQLLHL